ncbi:MAG: protein kinase [Rhodothermia bacterium]|nr:protein kinase [Rhodothermia bacterium]
MSDPIIGQEIDGYLIEGILGRGGMGIVYRAKDVALARDVALKVIDPALTRNESFLHRFHSEARALARVKSNHIVSVHALRQTRLGLCIVMEYVEGGTLADVIKKGAISVEESLDVARQILLAFKDAHGVGVVHRDIKPSNIMLTSDGLVKVTDFGLAKVHEPGSDSTVTQGMAGTLYYMSPEQVKGLRNVDSRSDLYSIGMTLYEMVTGRLPFDKTESQFTILKMIAEEKLEPPTKFRKDLPKPLARVIGRALEKDPGRRFASAEEMLRAVNDLQSSQELTPTRKKKSFVIPVAATLAVIGIGIAAYFLVPRILKTLASESGPVDVQSTTAVADVDSAELSTDPTLAADSTEVPDPVAALLADNTQTTPNSVDEPRSPARAETPNEREPVDAAPAEGRLDIRSSPANALVFVDGKQAGTTPGVISGITPGRREVVVRLGGYSEYRTTIDLRALDTYRLDVELERQTGTLRLRVIPWADVDIEGVESIAEVTAAWRSRVLPVGTYTVTATNPSLGRCTLPVSVASDRTNDVVVNYERKVGVPVTSIDSDGQYLTGAEIFLNGQSTDAWTPHTVELTVGCSYVVDVRKDGYSRSGRPLTVRRNEDESEPIRLTLARDSQ